ncbi:alpha/beta fold hydrolase [Lentzea sp. E54]|uniref:alpha/beta fold hydrolase n=1 Tax=Lentzea xerophila TaxID=3435883 RepID=UPI003DA56494
MAIAERAGTFRADGADISFAVRGGGPPVLVLPSGGSDAHSAAPLAVRLAETRSVLTYDRRGQSRTSVTDPLRPVPIEQHAEDVAALAAHVYGDTPVAVFGCSTGAVIGLELARQRPERVSVLVAHEPPLRCLANAAERAEFDALHHKVRQVHEKSGWRKAVMLLHAGFGAEPRDPLDREPDVGWEPPSRRTIANIDSFLAAEAAMTWAYRIGEEDWAGLRSGTARIQPAVGTASSAFLRRTTARLADVLGESLAVLPGGHEGFLTHPAGVASAVRALLTAPDARVSTSLPR